MSYNNYNPNNAVPVWYTAGPGASQDRANMAKAVPVWLAPSAPPGLNPKKAIPVYVTTNPPVTGDRANHENATPIWVISGYKPCRIGISFKLLLVV